MKCSSYIARHRSSSSSRFSIFLKNIGIFNIWVVSNDVMLAYPVVSPHSDPALCDFNLHLPIFEIKIAPAISTANRSTELIGHLKFPGPNVQPLGTCNMLLIHVAHGIPSVRHSPSGLDEPLVQVDRPRPTGAKGTFIPVGTGNLTAHRQVANFLDQSALRCFTALPY